MKHVTFLLAVLFVAFSDAVVRESWADGSRIVSWNVQSRQFIDSPAFQLLPVAKAAKYRCCLSRAVNRGRSRRASVVDLVFSSGTKWPSRNSSSR